MNFFKVPLGLCLAFLLTSPLIAVDDISADWDHSDVPLPEEKAPDAEVETAANAEPNDSVEFLPVQDSFVACPLVAAPQERSRPLHFDEWMADLQAGKAINIPKEFANVDSDAEESLYTGFKWWLFTAGTIVPITFLSASCGDRSVPMALLMFLSSAVGTYGASLKQTCKNISAQLLFRGEIGNNHQWTRKDVEDLLKHVRWINCTDPERLRLGSVPRQLMDYWPFGEKVSPLVTEKSKLGAVIDKCLPDVASEQKIEFCDLSDQAKDALLLRASSDFDWQKFKSALEVGLVSCLVMSIPEVSMCLAEQGDLWNLLVTPIVSCSAGALHYFLSPPDARPTATKEFAEMLANAMQTNQLESMFSATCATKHIETLNSLQGRATFMWVDDDGNLRFSSQKPPKWRKCEELRVRDALLL